MNIQTHIINEILPLDINSTVLDAQKFFNEMTYSHFPVLQQKTYLGCIAETDIRCLENNQNLEEFQYSLEGFFVRNDANWLDILEAFAQNNTNIMPALDYNSNYIGYFELNDIMNLFNETPFLNENGNILVVEKGMNDYSFSEVSQIVESNNAKILGVFISKMEKDVTQITVKINNSDINNIVQTFRRYSYNVVSSHSDDAFLSDLKERSQYLDRYLNM